MLGIVMDGPKAMNILGFPTHQTFDNTSQEEISKAFVFKMRINPNLTFIFSFIIWILKQFNAKLLP